MQTKQRMQLSGYEDLSPALCSGREGAAAPEAASRRRSRVLKSDLCMPFTLCHIFISVFFFVHSSKNCTDGRTADEERSRLEAIFRVELFPLPETSIYWFHIG